MRIVFERRRAEEQYVTTEAGDWRDGSPCGFSWMAGRAPEPLCLVYHEQIDVRLYRLTRDLGVGDQHLERDDCAAMYVERIEVATEVARDIREARSIEQRERLVILPPEFAEPLDRQRFRRDDKAAFHLAGVHEPIEDEGGFDRLSKSHFIGQQPAHGLSRRCALGNVELMRKQPDASSKKRTQPICLTEREEMQDPEARQKIVQLVQTARDQALDERPLEIRLRIRIDGNQCVGVCGESKLRAGARELHHERTTLEGRDSSDSQFRVETMGEVVA